MCISSTSPTCRPQSPTNWLRSFDDLLQPFRLQLADPIERIAAGCAAFIREALRNPSWGSLAARSAWALPAVASAARANLREDLRLAATKGRLGAITQELGFDIVSGIVLQAMRAAGERRLSPSDAPAAVEAILRAIGVASDEAHAIVERVLDDAEFDRPPRRLRAERRSREKVQKNMPVNLVRFEKGSAAHWGVVLQDGVAPLLGDYPTTADLIERGEADWREATRRREPSVALDSLEILSPVTAPCRVFCQGANYRRHMIELGMDPDAKAFNMFFTKTDASISPAIGAVRRPDHVALLDYEIELALVFRRAIRAPVTVTAATLKDVVFAVAIANDLSARDVQLPQTQFFKGKSYRGFCPIGPWLTVLEPDEFDELDRLDLRLSVNGVTRQSDSTANLVFKPAETITELTTFADIAAGDVLLTGNPRRLRPARSAPGGPADRAASARAAILETVPEVAEPPPAISSTRRSDQRDDPQRGRAV